MTTPGRHPAGQRVPPQEIADLIAWLRRLSDAGTRQADPAELAAFCHARQQLLARIGHHDHPQPPAGQPGDPGD